MKGKLRLSLSGLNQQSAHTTKLTWMLLLSQQLASRCYHVYKTASWINTKVGDKVTVELETTPLSLESDPYACAIRIRNKYFSNSITVGHIPREISRHVQFFIKIKGKRVNGHVKSLTFRPSSIPSGSLETPLQLTFSCGPRETLDIMNTFVNSLYDWNYTGINHPDENEENDENTDNEDFIRTSYNSNECDDIIILD